MTLKSLALISILIMASCSVDNRPYVKKTYVGEITYRYASSDSWRPNIYSIGIVMEDGETKLFEARYNEEANYDEVRRLYKVCKMGDKVKVTWYVREEKETKDFDDAEVTRTD